MIDTIYDNFLLKVADVDTVLKREAVDKSNIKHGYESLKSQGKWIRPEQFVKYKALLGEDLQKDLSKCFTKFDLMNRQVQSSNFFRDMMDQIREDVKRQTGSYPPSDPYKVIGKNIPAFLIRIQCMMCCYLYLLFEGMRCQVVQNMHINCIKMEIKTNTETNKKEISGEIDFPKGCMVEKANKRISNLAVNNFDLEILQKWKFIIIVITKLDIL